ncbi:hypothetical protein DPMN_164604 [Dreissena polymorpha]|uniref:protein-tyrosine-phosphatase n=1 Tax=Dreissena polymorpha TaxID=45954 RepID=A0A9D4EZ15_DREPO|nr:hypothetical protein DPMN_164604 [Dreissena polymorpha]
MYPRLCEGKIHELHMQTAGACNVSPINMHLTTSSSDDLQVLPTELLSHLYIGDERHSTNAVSLNRVGITAILSVSTSGADKQFPEFVYKWIPIHDNVSENISAWFQEALLFIDFIRENGGKTLVHCKAGVSRSATICIAYLMVYKSFSLDQAFDFVQSKRSIVAPNLSFMQQLSEFERLLLATNTRSSYMTSSPSMTPLLTCAKTSEVSGQQGTLGNCFVF